MQLIETPPVPTSRSLRLAPSPIIELHWALLAASSDYLCGAHAGLNSLYRSGILRMDVTAIWGQDPYCFPELLVLAHRAGVLEDEVADVLAAIEAVAAEEHGPLPLRTETEEERAAITRRLDRLRTDATFRRRYIEILAAVWREIEGEWLRVGRAAVEASIASTPAREEWQSLLISSCPDVAPWIERAEGWLRPGDQVLVAPAYFAGKALLVDLPGLLVVGTRLGKEGAERTHFEDLGRLLKSVADPTRLAILARAATGPVLVGKLAGDLGLAQPTVSNHVKLLRSSGLLVERRGEHGRRELVLDRDAVEGLSGTLLSEVLGTTLEA